MPKKPTPPTRHDDRLIEKAKARLLVDLGEGRYEAPSPALIRAAEEVLATAIGRLRPLAFNALNATFRLSLTTEIEKAFGEVLERRQKKK